MMADVPETNRDRVRRLLFAPLGFKWPKTKPAGEGQAELNAIADDLGYLTDDHLKAMARMMRVHGQGSAKCFWPERASFVFFAHCVKPLPLTEDRELLSWWASAAGQQMVQEGTLVETFEFFEAQRRPPRTDGARAIVREAADKAQRRLQIVAEREALEWPVEPAELAFRDWYLGRVAMLTELVATARAAKQQGAAA